MRTITADQQAVLDARVQAEHVRVWVKDAGGTFRDLTTYAGQSMVRSVTWQEDINDPHATFDIALHREVYRLSLSPYVASSALNTGFDPSIEQDPLISLAREVKIEVAIVPMDKAPSSGDWFEVFRGRIDTFDAAKGDDVDIGGRSLGGRLAQQYIKEERVYSFAEVSGVAVPMRIWQPDTHFVAGQYVLPASRGDSDPGFNRFYVVATTGDTGTTEPTWTTGSGITDNTAVFDYVGAPSTAGNPVEEIMQNILDDNIGIGDSSVTLSTPSSPGWEITQFLQKRTFTLDAVRALALQIGFDVRYKWNGSAFALTFYCPDRGASSPDYSFAVDEYGVPQQLSADIADIRNSWRGIYTDGADLWPDGSGKRKVIEVSDSGSIAKYGELWAEIQEDSASQIDSATEMTTMLNSALADCAEPTALMSVSLTAGFPWVELNDLYEFAASKYFDAAIKLAVTGWTQTFDNGKLTTALKLRGQPTIGSRWWLDIQFHPKIQQAAEAHRMQNFQGGRTATPIFNTSVGGSHLFFTEDFDKVQIASKEYEVHVYRDSGATLDDTTLAGVSSSPVLSLPHLEPGATYYARVVSRYRNEGRLVRGQPSAESSFIAGQAYAGHIQSGISLGDYPLNGGFETQFNALSMPDHWGIDSGTFGTDVEIVEDANGLSGYRYLRMKGGTVFTGDFPAVSENAAGGRAPSLYRLTFWRKSGSGVAGGGTTPYQVQLLWFDYTGAINQTLLLNAVSGGGVLVVSDPSTYTGVWLREEVFFQVDADARNIAFTIEAGGLGANEHIDIDEVRCVYLGPSNTKIADGSATTLDNNEATPAFDNSYLAFNTSTDSVPAFRKDRSGRVYLKGAFKHGTTSTVGSSLFTLPVGYRPPKKLSFLVQANGRSGLIEIGTGGAVTLVSADDANPSTKVSLDGISFDIDAY